MKLKGIIIFSVIVIVAASSLIIKIKLDGMIPTDYYAKLVKGSGEIQHCTYLYKEDKTHATYIQTTAMTESWGSTKWNEKVTKRGKLVYPQDVFDIAKENDSYGYVIMNADFPEVKWHKGYKKGDIITPDELYGIIAIN